MANVKRGRPRSKNIGTDVRYCDHHGQDCEFRQWRRGKYADGTERYVWSCAQRQNEVNKASYAAKAAR